MKKETESVITSSNTSEAMIHINRPVYTSDSFNETFPPKIPEKVGKTDAVRRFLQRNHFSCDLVKRLLYSILPVLQWLPKYNIRGFLLGDFVAGLTVGVVNIPQGMAFSLLAGLAPVYGLYVSFFPVLIYFLMGTSRHISVGTFAVVSIMCANAVEEIISKDLPTRIPTTDPIDISGITQNISTSSVVPTSLYMAEKVKIHTSLCLLVGIFQVLLGICHLGFVTVYLSDSLVRAFTCGAACHVITSQVKYLFGLDVPMHQEPLAIIYTWRDIFVKLPDTNAAEFIIALIAMISLIAVKILSTKYKEKIKFPIPIELIIVIIATIISYFGKLAENFGVDPVGHIPEGFPKPEVPSASYFGDLVGDAFAISIVGFAVSVSLAKIFASKHNYEISSNQELLAYGTANVVSSFFSCFVSAASLARSVLQDGVGGKTQLVSIIQCSMVLVVVLWLGPLLEPLPKVILAVIIIFALKDMIIQVIDLKSLWSQSKYDWMIWFMTLFGVLIFGVDIGLFVGVGFAFVTVVIRTQLPQYTISGNMAGTEIYKNIDIYPNAECPLGIKIFQMQSSLYFANVQQFCNRLYAMTGVHPVRIVCTINAETEKEQLRKRRKEKTKAERQLRSLGGGAESRTPSYQVDVPDDVCIMNNTHDTSISSDGDQPPTSTSTGSSSSDHGLQAIVIDCSTFNFIDLMAVRALISVVTNYEKIGVQVVLAQCKDSVQKTLSQGGFFEQVSRGHIYLTVHDAVVSLSSKTHQVPPDDGTQTGNSHHVQVEGPAESEM